MEASSQIISNDKTFLSFYKYLFNPPLGCPPPNLTSKYSLYSFVSGGLIFKSLVSLMFSKLSLGCYSGRLNGLPMYS